MTRGPTRVIRPTEDRGTALIEMVVLGFAVLLVVLPAVSAVVGLADARARAAAVAHDTAAAIARHGAEPERDDTVAVDVAVGTDRIVVVATIDVTIVSVLGTEVTITVSERAASRTSPYRSGR